MANRDWVDGKVTEVFSQLKSASVIDRATDAQTAFANLISVHDLIQHPQLRTRSMPVGGRTVEVPATPWSVKWESNTYVAAPALNEQEHKIRDEFAQ